MEIVPQAFAALGVFVGLPWLILHYVTRWKTAATLTHSDERMLEELHDIARRLDDRVATVERIVTADNPNWRAMACDPLAGALETDTHNLRRIK
ncbi:MAG TPA: envelope stress response membrane protein PspB [Allosphingosinicella sp.]|jgi:phage shock protein B